MFAIPNPARIAATSNILPEVRVRRDSLRILNSLFRQNDITMASIPSHTIFAVLYGIFIGHVCVGPYSSTRVLPGYGDPSPPILSVTPPC